MKILPIRILLVLTILIVASLACNLPQMGENTPSTPQPIPTEDLTELEQELQATLENPESNEVTITLTQQQLTSILASELAEQNDPILTDPSVELTNGQMIVYGRVSQSGFRVNTRTVLQPRIDANGDPKLDVVSVDLGPFPVPASMRSQFEGMADDALNHYLDDYSDQFQVTDITILEGQMTISGIRQEP
jgi:uncharacterized protein YpmS